MLNWQNASLAKCKYGKIYASIQPNTKLTICKYGKIDKLEERKSMAKFYIDKSMQQNLQVAVNETVKHCYRPLVSDCDVEGKPLHVQLQE